MVEALDHAPADITPGERLLLVALAEKADDTTRAVWWPKGANPRDVLRRRVGVSDSGLTKIFGRLAQRHLDPRVSLGEDRHGRPVYAYEGRAAEYRFPILRACPSGEAPVENKGVPVEKSLPQRGGSSSEGPREGSLDVTTGEALEPESLPQRGPLVPSIPQSPSTRASELPAEQQEAVRSIVARTAVDEDLAVDAVLALVRRRKPDNVQAYVTRFSADDVRRWARPPARDTRPAPSTVKRCRHDVVGGMRINGRGADSSRLCVKCENEMPAEQAQQIELELRGQQEAAS